MEENTEMITYLDNRIAALQNTYDRYKELEGPETTPANPISMHYNSVAAATLDSIYELNNIKSLYQKLHK